ncbi:MAG: exodeoxyribonuclease VII large subunit [Deltaproteobacteria bacterium]|nr:exodeoxyribonuclease VII large subunit [Deltaproteobacteria bacterium]
MQHESKKIFSVSELTQAIKGLLEANLYYVWLEGEISNFKRAASGHCYFTLKDETSQVRGVFFRGQAGSLRFKPEDGLQVICRGMVTVYEARGEYQVIIDYMEPVGVGARQLALEQRKERLAKEGYFEEERKRPLPILPGCVGVVTSSTGAVIRDIIRILERRHAAMGLLLYPVRVQGVEASREIAEGIEALNRRDDVDVIIVGRGGGSVEDLWAFNEEVVAKAIFKSRLPVISAVGHETDYTLADLVADVRAPTPSAAAEIVVKSREEFSLHLSALQGRMKAALLASVDEQRIALRGRERGLIDPRRRYRDMRLRLDDMGERLNMAVSHRYAMARGGLEATVARLNALSPLSVLQRGYSIARKMSSHAVIRDAAEVSVGEDINVMLYRGELSCKVYEKIEV